MNLSEVIELDYLEAGADPELARFVKKLIATYVKDAKQLCVELPNRLERLRFSSPLDDSRILQEILEVLPSASDAPDNLVLYRALCRLVAIKLPVTSIGSLSQLAMAIASQSNPSEENHSALSELVVEAIIGALGSLHPAVSQTTAVKGFLNTPFLVDFPEALGELMVRIQS